MTLNILTAGTHLPGLKEGTEKELNVVMLKMVAALTARSVRNTGKEIHTFVTLGGKWPWSTTNFLTFVLQSKMDDKS